MYRKADYIKYGSQGICRIEDIRSMRFDRGAPPRTYYVLQPLQQAQEQLFVPADNPTLLARMQPVLSPEEIDQIIASVKGQTLPWIQDRKQRAEQFRSILIRQDERELLMLAACLYCKAQETPKGLSASDAQVLKAVEAAIEQEFAFSLQMGTQQVGSYIRGKLSLGSSPTNQEQEEPHS